MENEEENETMLEKMKEIIAEQLNEYSVEIPSEDLEKLTTVSAVMDYLKAKGVEG